MRKKILSAFIALTMAAACLTACSEEGTERDGRVMETTTTTAATTTTEQTTTAPVTTEQTTTTMQESKIDVGFQTYTYKYKDTQNYEYEVTLTLSPWILESKADVLDAAWAKVGKGHSKPSKDNMNLQKYSNNRCMTTSNNSPYHLSNTFDATVTEMYFSVGTVTVKNVTNGWSFSEQEPGSTDFSLYWIKNIEKTLVYSQDHFITRNIYSESEEFNVGEIFVRPKMKKDKWGPMTIVLGHAENFSPKYPNGEYRKEVENGYLQAGSDTIIKIPIYGESNSTVTEKTTSQTTASKQTKATEKVTRKTTATRKNKPAGDRSEPVFDSAYATSTLAPTTYNGKSFTYNAKNVIDNDNSTCWCEGASGYGEGETIMITADTPQNVGSISIMNGICGGKNVYYRNCRVKDCRISFSDGSSFDYTLKGEFNDQPQVIKLKNNVSTTFIKLTILSVYPGSTYEDTCISEIKVAS